MHGCDLVYELRVILPGDALQSTREFSMSLVFPVQQLLSPQSS